MNRDLSLDIGAFYVHTFKGFRPVVFFFAAATSLINERKKGYI
jgi:hypothetical protein